MGMLRIPAHKEHMSVLLLAVVIVLIVSYAVGWTLYNALPDETVLAVSLFALLFLDTVLLIIIASFLLKIYEQLYK